MCSAITLMAIDSFVCAVSGAFEPSGGDLYMQLESGLRGPSNNATIAVMQPGPPRVLNSSQLVRNTDQTIAIGCLNCPPSSTDIQSYTFGGSGSLDLGCVDITVYSQDGFICQLSGSMTSAGGSITLQLSTTFGISNTAVVGSVVPGKKHMVRGTNKS